jgi:hypothetical protein
MIGFLVFLICVFIVVILVKAILAELLPGNANAVKIAMLVILLFALIWLFGGGGWGYTTNFHPWARG